MTDKLQGAYVQAWVWVDYDTIPFRIGVDTEKSPDKLTEIENEFRSAAKRLWQDDGQIEVDDDAKVSLSYEGG